MKRTVIFLLFLSILYSCKETVADAQLWKMRRMEISAGLGPSFFFGDIGGFSKSENALGLKDLSFLQTRVNYGLTSRYRILEDLNLRFNLSGAIMKATDVRGSNETRGMEAEINIFEPALIGEFYFIKNKAEGSYLFSKGQRTGLRRIISFLDFYALTGFGGAVYSVEGNDKLTSKGMKKGGFTPVIPVGFGSTLVYSPYFNIGVELAGRYSFSDYLDGYSSQYSSSNDVYYFLNFTFTYKMKTNPKGWPTFKEH